MITLLLIGLLSTQTVANTTEAIVRLTPMERDIMRLHGYGDGLDYLDANCQPFDRKIVHGHEMVRFRCPEGIRRVMTYDGRVEVERASIKERLMYVVGGIVTVIIIYGKSKS